jgi:hypothetical protein
MAHMVHRIISQGSDRDAKRLDHLDPAPAHDVEGLPSSSV